MRVVAGEAGGRKLVVPAGHSVRPTSDRVREAVFNALESRQAIEGADVLDLFAGSGALGIEALSRGARRATFVESDASARRAIETNLDVTGLASRAVVVARQAEQFLVGGGPIGRVDLALLDPPYAFAEWDSLLGSLRAETIVIETGRELDLDTAWEVVRRKWYGSTLVLIACRRADDVSRSEAAIPTETD